MSEAQTEKADKVNDESEEQGDQTAPAKGQGFDTVALRELRRARRLIRDADKGGTIAPEATLAVGIANVLALLDLASAIRAREDANGR